jgi:alpha-galactosidase
MKFVAVLISVVLILGAVPTGADTGQDFPDWSFHLKLWPFDILLPSTTHAQITERLDIAVTAQANATIVYIEEEHMYGTFVDETGFAGILQSLAFLTSEAHQRGLKVIVYVNGLEVMTHGAVDPVTCAPQPIATMAKEHPDWMQLDLEGEPVVYSCLDLEWVTADMEDAWVSPFSPYRDLFKNRIAAFGTAGIDGVYIDATFLPGLQLDEENPRWATTDQAAAAAFTTATGLELPTEEDWSDPRWREWLRWRHAVIGDYLGDLADAAWVTAMVPFWESSTNDTDTGTLLGNETAITARNTMGFSPEIEPEGDGMAAFRMFQSARDFAPDHPLIYLGWPETRTEADEQLATALSFSSTLYPTADAPYPSSVFAFADSIRNEVLKKRSPHWGHVALIYSTRNKDWTYPEAQHFEAYDAAWRELTSAHIPFRILVLEDLTSEALAPFDTVILPALPSISDAEHALLKTKNILALDEVGTRDEMWASRTEPLSWPHLVSGDLEDLETGLPFELEAPLTTRISFFDDGAHGFFLFAVPDPGAGGSVSLLAEEDLDLTLFRPGQEPENLGGTSISIPDLDSLGVIHIKGTSTEPTIISDDVIHLEIDDHLLFGATLSVNGQDLTTILPSAANFIVVDGVEVTGFDVKGVSHQNLNNALGTGTRTTVAAQAAGPSGASIEITLMVDIYDRYPGSILTQATYRNLGSADLSIDEIWSATLDLDRRLSLPGADPFDFKMLSLGTIWGNGERDRIWDLGADSAFDNFNGGDVTNPEIEEGHWGGGGTPLTTVWGREMAVTVGVLSEEIQVLGVPVTTRENGEVRLGVRQTIDLPTLAPGESVTTPTSIIELHTGDFFDGIAAYGGMMKDLGALPTTYSSPTDFEAYWCSFGLDNWRGESPADRDLVEALLYIPRDLGLGWINIDSGWEHMGTCTVNSEQFSDEDEFTDWIADLHSEGFKVSTWIDVGFGDDEDADLHPDWFIKNNDGTLFTDAWERHAMDPTIPEVQQFVTDCITKLVTPQDLGGWGIDRFFVDGAFLVPPDFSGRHQSPHETEKAGDILYRIVHDTARTIVPDFPIECCGSGGVTNAWIQRWASTTSISDPDRLELRTQEIRTKIDKALFGANAAVNGDHIEGTSGDQHFDMSYLFPLNLGLGNVFQTYFWEEQWRTDDPLGLGDEDLYREWFHRYDELRLSEGRYLNLYDLAFDVPGAHAIAKDHSIYYLFAPPYGETYSGQIELRGLEEGEVYEVIDYENNRSLGWFEGPVITLDVDIGLNDPLLLRAKTAVRARRGSGRSGP